MKQRSVWIYIMLGLLLITAITYRIKRNKENLMGGQQQRMRTVPRVDAVVIKPRLLINEISVSGSILAYESVDLKTEVAGRVVKLNLPEGEFVREGTLLVKLYDEDLQADLHKLQTQLDIQQQMYDRQSELYKVNGISQNDYEQTGLQLNSLKAQIEVQRVMIRKTEVLAPFDGVIGLRNISIGAQVTPSTLLATLRKRDKLKLDFSVPEKYGPSIRPGMEVRFSQYNDSIKYKATVMATERGIDADTRNLRIRAVINSPSEQLIPGAFTNVQLELSNNRHALLVPTQAIIPQEQIRRLIIAKSGKAHFVKVKTGTRLSSEIEINEGIHAGDTVITSGILFLKEGVNLVYSSVKADSL